PTTISGEWLWKGGYWQVNGTLRKRTSRISTRTTVQAHQTVVCRRAVVHPQNSSVQRKVSGPKQKRENIRSTRLATERESCRSGSSHNRKIQFARRSSGISKAKRMPTSKQ